MGANLQILGFKDSIKTAEQALKDFDKRAEQDRDENGNEYSGSYGMLNRLRPISKIFDTVEEFEAWLMDKDKNDGYLAQVRIIRETTPLKKAKTALFYARRDVSTAPGGHLYAQDGTYKFTTVKPTPALLKRLQAKLDKARAKYQTLLAAQIVKSTKTRFMAGGWVSE